MRFTKEGEIIMSFSIILTFLFHLNQLVLFQLCFYKYVVFYWFLFIFCQQTKLRTNQNMKKIALITGITGQDGSYLVEFLLKKYLVHGIIRISSSFNTGRIDHLYQDPLQKSKNLILHYGDMTDSLSLQRIIDRIQLDEIYNLQLNPM